MAIYALSDLHLSFNTDKPMDIFGEKWQDHTDKIAENWQKTVNNDDLVIIPGDVSWAMYLNEIYADFNFINKLNGKKIISKGNHDYWWTTMQKMNEFVQSNDFDTINFLNNNAFVWEDTVICGTRGWSIIDSNVGDENKKIFEREKQRLILSLESAVKLKKERIVVAMHYPPLEENNDNHIFLDIMNQYSVDICVYGHLHAASHKKAVEGMTDGIDLKLVSCDYVDFTPILI